MIELRTLRLIAPQSWVDVRLVMLDGRWIASADTPDGPTVGLGGYPVEAVAKALTPFHGVVDELLKTVPDELYWR